MKKIRILLAALLFTAFSLSLVADDLTDSQKALRSNIVEFLREEGFSPSIDEDGDVAFKKEGEKHWIRIARGGPFYIEFIWSFHNIEDADLAALMVAINKVNKETPVAKAILLNESVKLVVEAYCHDAESFRYIFYESMRQLEMMDDDLRKSYEEFASRDSTLSEPFTVNSVEVANVDYDGNVIYDYGDTIYSRKTRYLKPRLYVKVNRPGSYDIYVKLYNSSGNLATGSSSPSGYSYKYTASISENSSSIPLSGWGSNSDGHWSSGNYRFEFYYNGKLITTKYFTIY